MFAGLFGFAIDVGDAENLVIQIVHRYQASTVPSSFESVDPLPRVWQFRRGQHINRNYVPSGIRDKERKSIMLFRMPVHKPPRPLSCDPFNHTVVLPAAS
jgi:hypothetical protein